MRLFKLRAFEGFGNKESITDHSLKEVVARREAGHINASLGGFVFKQRLARQGGGESGGYSVIVYYRQGERVFFAFGFAKSAIANIRSNDLAIFKAQADVLMHSPDDKLGTLLENAILIEF